MEVLLLERIIKIFIPTLFIFIIETYILAHASTMQSDPIMGSLTAIICGIIITNIIIIVLGGLIYYEIKSSNKHSNKKNDS